MIMLALEKNWKSSVPEPAYQADEDTINYLFYTFQLDGTWPQHLTFLKITTHKVTHKRELENWIRK